MRALIILAGALVLAGCNENSQKWDVWVGKQWKECVAEGGNAYRETLDTFTFTCWLEHERERLYVTTYEAEATSR